MIRQTAIYNYIRVQYYRVHKHEGYGSPQTYFTDGMRQISPMEAIHLDIYVICGIGYLYVYVCTRASWMREEHRAALVNSIHSSLAGLIYTTR